MRACCAIGMLLSFGTNLGILSLSMIRTSTGVLVCVMTVYRITCHWGTWPPPESGLKQEPACAAAQVSRMPDRPAGPAEQGQIFGSFLINAQK
jgi:hypothetical protein